MAEPRIQYAKTSDGVSIAFWTIGSGHPLVHMPLLQWSHVHLEWTMPEQRAWYELLARRYQLVRYDTRGTGLSDRRVTDYSVDALVRDLQASLIAPRCARLPYLRPPGRLSQQSPMPRGTPTGCLT